MEMADLVREATTLGLTLDSNEVAKLSLYMEMLLECNQKFNLTAIEEPGEVVRKHFLDSMSVLKVITGQGMLVDVGSGAGFPGIPLAIVCPELRVTLLDSLQKRVRFLDEVVDELKLTGRVSTIHMRAEDAGQAAALRERYDIAVSRAVARFAVLAELCLPLVKVGGLFVAMKGPAVTAEVNEASTALSALGGKLVGTTYWQLPGGENEERALVCVQKVNRTPTMYPRQAGTPAKKPLM